MITWQAPECTSRALCSMSRGGSGSLAHLKHAVHGAKGSYYSVHRGNRFSDAFTNAALMDAI